MRRMVLLPFALAAGAALLFGCAEGPQGIPKPPAPASGVQLHVGPWVVQPGQEINRCTTFHLDDEMLVDGIETWTSEHVHHFATTATIVYVPDGVHDCSEVFTDDVMRNSQTVFSTTRTHHQIIFPPGMAGKLSAGFTTVILAMHYINASPKPLVAEGYLNLTTTTKDKVTTLVNGVVAHQRMFSLPPHSVTHPTGRCMLDRPIDVLAIGSHAHSRMTSLEIRILKNGVRPDLPDYVNYDWATPQIDMHTDAPIHLNAGDGIEWICNYENDGDTTIVEGQNTTDEMCTAVLVYAPDQGFLTCDVTPDAPVGTVRVAAPPGTL